MRCEITGTEHETLDEHHVIPREYGGINGPVVRISPTLHQAIHRYANNSANLGRFLDFYPPDIRSRIKMLVLAVTEAKRTLNKVSNNQITLTLPDKEYNKLKQLADETGMSVNAAAKKLLCNLL